MQHEEVRSKVIGETWIETDTVVKQRSTKNTETLTIKRHRVRAILLECGHSRPVTEFAGKVPTVRTICVECSRDFLDERFQMLTEYLDENGRILRFGVRAMNQKDKLSDEQVEAIIKEMGGSQCHALIDRMSERYHNYKNSQKLALAHDSDK